MATAPLLSPPSHRHPRRSSRSTASQTPCRTPCHLSQALQGSTSTRLLGAGTTLLRLKACSHHQEAGRLSRWRLRALVDMACRLLAAGSCLSRVLRRQRHSAVASTKDRSDCPVSSFDRHGSFLTRLSITTTTTTTALFVGDVISAPFAFGYPPAKAPSLCLNLFIRALRAGRISCTCFLLASIFSVSDASARWRKGAFKRVSDIALGLTCVLAYSDGGQKWECTVWDGIAEALYSQNVTTRHAAMQFHLHFLSCSWCDITCSIFGLGIDL